MKIVYKLTNIRDLLENHLLFVTLPSTYSFRH